MFGNDTAMIRNNSKFTVSSPIMKNQSINMRGIE